MKKLFTALVLGTCCWALTACYGEDYSCKGHEKCSSYGQVTKCKVNSYGQTICETRNECTTSVCCHSSNSCNGANCLETCGGGFAPLSNKLTSGDLGAATQLKDLTPSELIAAAANADIYLAQSLGLSLGDIQSLMSGDMISNSSVQGIAIKLSESPEFVRKVFEDAIRAFQVQRYDATSGYWQTCLQSGAWSTDKNPKCKSTSWSGCSPDDGATQCISKTGQHRLRTYFSKSK